MPSASTVVAAVLRVIPLLQPAVGGNPEEWAAFLSRSDPINRFDMRYPMTIPDVWLEGSFAGNGMIGVQVLICPNGVCRQSLLLGANTSLPADGPSQVVIPLARGDVSDIRTGANAITCSPPGTPPQYAGCGISDRIARARLGVGDLILGRTRGRVLNGTIRTHLHNATISASITTTRGGVEFRVYVHAQRQVVVVEGLRGLGGEAGNVNLTWEFRPAPALPPGLFKQSISGPYTVFTGAAPPPNYTLNPPPTCTASRCQQALQASKEARGWVTAWADTTAADDDDGDSTVPEPPSVSASDAGSRLLVVVTCDLPTQQRGEGSLRAPEEATRALAAATAMTPANLATEHASWWAAYYWSVDGGGGGGSGAFISLPAVAAQVEQFHYIQVMKVGAENACRRFKDSGAAPASFLDNCVLLDGINGPLSVSKTKWSDAIWDMNVEGSQWASLGINAIEQARALVKRIPEQLPNFIASVPPALRNDSAAISGGTASLSFLAECAVEYCPEFPLCTNFSAVPDLPCLVHSTPLPKPPSRQVPKGFVFGSNLFGALPWVCHSMWLVYRHTMDVSILRDLEPLLTRATNLYIRTAVRGADGKLTLPEMFSPEYANAAHLSFDHALFRWCLRTSIRIATTLLPPDAAAPNNTRNAAQVSRLRAVLKALAPPLVDSKTGSLMIGEGVPFSHANKHFSHLFSIFPLGLLEWSVPEERALWTRSLGLFKHYNDPTVSAEGFTYLGMALMTMLSTPSLPGGAPPDWADHALGNITGHFFGVPQLGAGTMYADHAACGPVAGCRRGMAGACNESPIMASLALQHMLLQSWNDRPIAIFPSIPTAWQDARFSRMRAEGAVLVAGACPVLEACITQTDLPVFQYRAL